jgi:parvulin-like peptidyl-prolyl isomerase
MTPTTRQHSNQGAPATARAARRPLAGGGLAAVLVAAVLLAALAARSGGEDDPVLAKVGRSRIITRSELEGQFKRLQVPPDADPDSVRKALLESLIQKELLVLEAKERGYFDARVDSTAEAYGAALLRDQVRDGEGRVDTTVTDAEIDAWIARGKDEIRMRHIIHWSQGAIDSARRRIDAGEGFAAVAKEVSLDNQTAPDGGLLWWLTDRQLITEFREALYPLAIGKVVGPFQSVYGWHLAVIDSLRPVAATDQALDRTTLKADILATRQGDRRNAVLAGYRQDHGYRPAEKALSDVVFEAEAALSAAQGDSVFSMASLRSKWAPREPDRALATYNEGRVSVADYHDRVLGGSVQNLNRRLNQFGVRADVREIFYERVRLAEARQRGLDQEPDWKRKVALKREELAVDRLYGQMTEDIRFADDELRAYYDEHPEQFHQDEIVRYSFFRVDDPSVAQWLVEELEPIAQVAFDSTITAAERQRASAMFDSLEAEAAKNGHVIESQRDSGRREAAMAPKVAEAARTMKVGEVGHIVEAEGLHTVFILMEHTPEGTVPFEKAKWRVERTLANTESEKRLKAMLDDLEGKYGVERHVERLGSSQG